MRVTGRTLIDGEGLSLAERSSRALLAALRGTPAQARTQVGIHLRDLLANRKEKDAADAG